MTSDESHRNDLGAARLLETLEPKRDRRRRMPLEQLWEAFHEAFPHLRGHPEARRRLRKLIDELAGTERCRLPRTSKLYDRLQDPPLPLWVEWPREDKERSPRERSAEVAWHPRLAFVPSLVGLSDAELEAARRIQEFLAEAGERPWLTVRERSLRLFGDDKRLEELAKGRLFGPDRLDLEHLRCRPVHLPVVYRELGHGDEALIIENKDTFHSACRAAEDLGPRCLFRWIVFGAGHAINRSIHSLLDWPRRPRRIFYFGDLDARGLEIAIQLAETAAPLRLPPMECAGWLYEALVASARTLDLDLRGRRCTTAQIEDLAGWLPPSIRSEVSDLLERGGRWPQEALAEPDLIDLLERRHLADQRGDPRPSF